MTGVGFEPTQAEPTVLQPAPASTSTPPMTCINTSGRCPLQRRCPPYVRALGHPRCRSRVQACTARPAPRNRRQKHLRRRVHLPGATPRAPPGRTPPHTRLAQAPSRRSKPVHLLSARDAPSRYFPQTRATGQRRNHPGPAPARRKRTRSVPTSTRTTTTQEPLKPPHRPDLPMSGWLACGRLVPRCRSSISFQCRRYTPITKLRTRCPICTIKA